MRKRIRKVHLRTDKTNSGLACNSTVFTPLLTSDLDQVTCNCCNGTDIFKRKVQKMESERVASSDELGIKDDDFEVIEYELGSSGICKTHCNYTDLLVGSASCSNCSYCETYNTTKQQVKCSFKAKNKPKNSIVKFGNVTVFKDDKHMEVTGLNREEFNLLFDFLKKKSIGFSGTTDKTEIIPDIKSYETIVDFIKQNYNDLDETSKKQDPDLFTKYNLNSTHKAFIEECGEVEAFKQDNKNCFGCCFHFQSMNPESSDYIDCTGVKCIENKIKFRLKKEEIMSDKTEISINDGTPGKQLSCYFSKLSVGDYFIVKNDLYRKVRNLKNDDQFSMISVNSGVIWTKDTELYKTIEEQLVEMVEKVTIQYIRREQ